MTIRLKLFDPEAVCPKCGCMMIETKYFISFLCEVLRRKCAGCGYAWDEAPLDHKEYEEAKK